MFVALIALVAAEMPPDRQTATAAVYAHRRCRRERDPASCADARRLYQAALSEHPADTINDDLRFFLAELHNDVFDEFEAAAPLYRQVAEEGGRYVHQARFNHVFALNELRRRDRARDGASTTAWDSALLAACDWYVQLEPDSEHAPQVALLAAAVALDDGSLADAERRWSDLRHRWPSSEEASRALERLGDELSDERAVRRLAALAREVRAAGTDSPQALESFASSLAMLTNTMRAESRWAESAALASEASLLVERPEMMNAAVELYLSAGEPDHALVAVDAFLARWPKSSERGHALLVSAMLNQRLGRHEAAGARFIEASLEPEPVAEVVTDEEPSEDLAEPEVVEIE